MANIPHKPMLRETNISPSAPPAGSEPASSENPAWLQLDAPTIVFGGPYSNLEATRALLREAERLGIRGERLICTGDVVAYCADAGATVELVRNSGARVVRGNCEESLGTKSDDCGCGFVPGSRCESLAASWFDHADRTIDYDTRCWMRTLPGRIDLDWDGARVAVVHGAISSINRFVFASTAAEIKQSELKAGGVDGLIGGHCGVPFTQLVGGKLWHNCGAIGMPANDGTPRGWFTLLIPEPDGLRIEHRALHYDHLEAAEKMRAAGLPEDYADALSTGLWPSCDVLPYREIRQRGVPLEPATTLWKRPVRHRPRSRRRHGLVEVEHVWPDPSRDNVPPLSGEKFVDPLHTAHGEPRASVALTRLDTVWFNTGSLCNIACRNCYLQSNPRNDRLAFLSRRDVRAFLDEIAHGNWGTQQIGFTGGEPFVNPDLIGMLEDSLTGGFTVLVLTNAMRPMQRRKTELLQLNARWGRQLHIRVSLDHFTCERHEEERGLGSFEPTLNGLEWLARNGFKVTVAARTMWGADEGGERRGFAQLFARRGIPLDAADSASLVLFPEMDCRADAPEIAAADWQVMRETRDPLMCASSRMVLKRNGSPHAVVVACTLIPYDAAFELGRTLGGAAREVRLNHPHCAQFCVFGGSSCNGR